MKYHFTNTNSR